ncbi:hypothetical protein CLOM_g20646 [Closterium sp. NIES-68]|nr:hypothetical protein CLOM_g20646 [Closterium sp. NIES-68]GJP82155.1 hypothetical protein CLOP_g12369 [Closterium sp. NIES-67]
MMAVHGLRLSLKSVAVLWVIAAGLFCTSMSGEPLPLNGRDAGTSEELFLSRLKNHLRDNTGPGSPYFNVVGFSLPQHCLSQLPVKDKVMKFKHSPPPPPPSPPSPSPSPPPPSPPPPKKKSPPRPGKKKSPPPPPKKESPPPPPEKKFPPPPEKKSPPPPE